ncbi:MAG: hypothetical protein LH618_18235 [Saprospiraceae bacterium]|nr:hypothetical protein [Saprospiraceae bacterium]
MSLCCAYACSFEHGQLYVALSRCRTLEGIVLRQLIRPQDVITDMNLNKEIFND